MSQREAFATADTAFILKTHNCDVPFEAGGVMSLGGSLLRLFELHTSYRLGHGCLKCGKHHSGLHPSLFLFLLNPKAARR